ncbi:MAG: hypothetical protein B6D56_02675 [Candidatus Omnitrophica bacterium 4484_70.1]|nr:MAG: hypothetical protein B6D56_02675 [Candidatus Omnitrophica bacterium 4484_70.1]
MRKSFTLVEIMIVVAIIALLAAIAIPSFLRARLNANESAAVSALHTISTAAQSYRSVNPKYPSALTSLSSAEPAYIDSVLGSGAKQGYSFYLEGHTYTFSATARPVTYGKTGVRSFYVDESGIIRYTTANATPTTTSPVLE